MAKKAKKVKTAKGAELRIVNPNAAGIDIAAVSAAASSMEAQQRVVRPPPFTAIAACGCATHEGDESLSIVGTRITVVLFGLFLEFGATDFQGRRDKTFLLIRIDHDKLCCEST